MMMSLRSLHPRLDGSPKTCRKEDIAKVKARSIGSQTVQTPGHGMQSLSPRVLLVNHHFVSKGIVTKKSPFPLKLETLGFEVLKSSGSKDGDNETNPEDGEADVANVGADAEGSSPKTLNDARWAFETWQNLVTSLELSTWSDCF